MIQLNHLTTGLTIAIIFKVLAIAEAVSLGKSQMYFAISTATLLFLFGALTMLKDFKEETDAFQLIMRRNMLISTVLLAFGFVSVGMFIK